MRRLVILLAVVALVASACQQVEEAVEPTPDPLAGLTEAGLAQALLSTEDIGEGWTQEEDPTHSTVQVGGRVGPGNMQNAQAQVVSAFEQQEGSGYLSNSIFLMQSPDVARSVMLIHLQSAENHEWTQAREDGEARFTLTGEIADLPELGDQMFTATMNVVITQDGRETARTIEYVVYRIDRILAFVVAQDASVGTFARRQEEKVARLVT